MTEPGAAPTRRGVAHAVRDHLEAIVIALVMALVLKQFCVEAFSIPTSSMHPTLIGENQAPDGVGDRILVDKIANWVGDPQRWEIWVFRFPLDRSRNFIKRVVGVPGDRLKIGSEDGDIWIARQDGAPYEIARKPRRVRESIYRPVYPPSEAPDRSKDLDFGPTGPRWFGVEQGDPTSWHMEALDRFVFRGGTAAVLKAAHPIHTSTDPASWHRSWQEGPLARDIRVRARVVPAAVDAPDGDEVEPVGTSPREPEATRVVLSWKPDGYYEYRLALSSRPGTSTARILVDGAVLREVRLDATLVPGRALDTEIEAVDGDLRVWFDGAEVAVLPDGRPFRRRHAKTSQELRIEASGGVVAVEDLRIDRDIAYQNTWSPLSDAVEDGIAIPPGKYLMIGDNQGDVGDRREGSYDGRKWELNAITLRDGTVIRHDEQARVASTWDEATGGTIRSVTDEEGVERRWPQTDEDPAVPGESHWMPFVSRELFVGRAFLVFWPAWPDPPGRFRRVR